MSNNAVLEIQQKTTILEITQQKNELVIGEAEAQTVLEIETKPQVGILTIGVQGPAGRDGVNGVSGIQLVLGEIPSGAANDSNATFNSEFAFAPESVAVYIENIRLIPLLDFYTTGNQTIHLSVSPLAGETIQIDYVRA